MEEWLDTLDQMGNILFTVVLGLLYIITRKLISRNVKRYGRKRDFSLSRVKYTIKYLHFIFFAIYLIPAGFVWDISFKGLSVYFVTFFTVAGIALFAAWSILSNITASIILFFYFPYRIGSRVRIMDGDNSVEGLIYDLNFFSILIKNEEGQLITYPNNLALQKAIVILSDPK
ncbi:mechanosensitive ion channel family protein [Marinoscillum sp. MHG1-6]|uniref:mechanosensitive ion channel family protein n=1 Tax=Marinoscillum sp. MHG1-6 TaxID=2959627 RepID=UPI00215802F0|nr:mechanosensitive ion channel family protein [Marinoscillum sp. MHG1-6]